MQLEYGMRPQDFKLAVFLTISERPQSARKAHVQIKSLKRILTTKLEMRLIMLLWLSKIEYITRFWRQCKRSNAASWNGSRSITESSGRGPNSVVQNADQRDFTGITENTPLTSASSRVDLNLEEGDAETRNVGNFEDGDFPVLRPNYDRRDHAHPSHQKVTVTSTYQVDVKSDCTILKEFSFNDRKNLSTA